MATIIFFTRTTSKQAKLIPVYCRLRSGRQVDITAKSGIKVQPDQFSNKTQTVRPIVEATNKDKINKELRTLRNHILTELAKNHESEEISPAWLKRIIDQFWNPEKYMEKGQDLFSFIKDFIAKADVRINPKTGRPVSYKMVREYERTYYYLKEYCQENKLVLDFKDIDLDFYYSFTEYLQGLNLATNTIGKKIQTLKIFLNSATDRGINQYKHFKSPRFTAISEESDSIYLTKAELEKIYETNLSNHPKLEKVRDLFIVGCWTGVRFSDIPQITPETINNGLISIKQSKTGGKAVIPVHPMVQTILDKYDGTLPRVITNQRFNEYLKDVAKAARINDKVHKSITKGGIGRSTAYKKWELVTTHCGRRSFATNNYLMGVPTLTIMAITGHKTESSFLKYIKVTPTEHAHKIRDIWQEQAKLRVVS